jgi:hypothetical protein
MLPHTPDGVVINYTQVQPDDDTDTTGSVCVTRPKVLGTKFRHGTQITFPNSPKPVSN